MFPSIREYIQSIELSAETLQRLTHLVPVRRVDGQLHFSSGNFAVVFRMQDSQTGQQVALRCFLREAEGRTKRLPAIAQYLRDNPATYLLPFAIYPNELWVDTRFTQEQEFDVMVMPWVTGQTLSQYVAECCRTEQAQILKQLAHRFDKLVQWLLNQPMAHGDLKADNILVRPDGQLVLIDYDGCFVPKLTGQEATETGTLPYRHPARTTAHFDRHIDDFSLLALSLELHALSVKPSLHTEADTLLLNVDTISNPFQADQWTQFRRLASTDVSTRASLLEYVLHRPPKPIFELIELISAARSSVVPAASLPNAPIPYRQKGQWGFVSQSNELIKPAQWESAGLFAEGLAPVRKSGKWGFCNAAGELVIECQYEEVQEFRNSLALVRHGGKYGFINAEGQSVIPCLYEEAGYFSEGRALVKLNDAYGFIDEQGQVVIPCQYASAGRFAEGVARVKQDGQYGFIDTAGTVRIPFNLPFALNFSEGLAVVGDDGQYGFITKQGTLTIPHQFDLAGSFNEGLAMVQKARKIGFIDHEGRLIIPYEFDETLLSIAVPFTEGLAPVQKRNLFGYINKQGQTVIPYQFTDADNFSGGLAAVRMGEKWGYINTRGDLAIPAHFDHAYRFRNGLALVRANNQLVYINQTGYAYCDQT